MSQEAFLRELAETLRTDTGAGSLVALTGHTSSDIRIARKNPKIVAKLPFLGLEVDSIPLMRSDVTNLQKSLVRYYCYAADDLVAIRIGDRVENLLHYKTGLPNTEYYNFSGTDVSIRSNRFKRRDAPIFRDAPDCYFVVIHAEVIWVDETCSTS